MLVVFLYGGLIWGVFPIAPRMSWESHLWGGLAGLAMAIVYRKVPPAFLPDRTSEALDDHEDGDAAAGHDAAPAGPRIRIVYEADPGDEVDDEELRWKRELGRRTELDDRRTDSTWPVEGPY
ncbi:MAG: hypothetical protein IPM68_11315 [Flavobacteriales bacterium]|nr:hypothetical protein [Flavobacteriales bacterium]